MHTLARKHQQLCGKAQLASLQRHMLRLQGATRRGRAEAEPVALVIRDALRQDLARTHIARNVAIDVRVPLDLRAGDPS